MSVFRTLWCSKPCWGWRIRLNPWISTPGSWAWREFEFVSCWIRTLQKKNGEKTTTLQRENSWPSLNFAKSLVVFFVQFLVYELWLPDMQLWGKFPSGVPYVAGFCRSLTFPPCASRSSSWASRTRRRFLPTWRKGQPGRFRGEPPSSWHSKDRHWLLAHCHRISDSYYTVFIWQMIINLAPMTRLFLTAHMQTGFITVLGFSLWFSLISL